MKSVTEFASFTLKAAAAAKTTLTTEGKTPEEVQASLGEKFKLAEEKLQHFVNAIGVFEANSNDLKRIVVVSLSEGENPPSKATKVGEHHYVPEFHVAPRPAASEKKHDGKGGGRGGKSKGGGRGEKESPWGLSPEQKAAKKAGGAANATKPAKPN